MMQPPSRRISGIASRAQRKAPVRFTRRVSSHSFSEILSADFVGPFDSCIVDKDIDLAPALTNIFEGTTNLAFTSQVAAQHASLDVKLRCECLRAFKGGRDIEQCQTRTFSSKGPSKGPPEPASGPGDHRDWLAARRHVSTQVTAKGRREPSFSWSSAAGGTEGEQDMAT